MKPHLLIALMLGTPALAECPTAADLSGGVRVTEDDGTTNTFTLIGDGVVQNDGLAPDGYAYRNLLAKGTHLIGLSDTQNGQDIPDTVRRMQYPVAASDLPVPTPSSRASYDTTVSANGGSYPEEQVQAWGTMTTLTIGECTYDMIPGKVVYTNDSYVVNEGLHYLPALELALLYSYQIEGDPADIYTPVRIEALQ